ncbi:nuclease-related domain-containing protein [Bacillus sp. DTU_2020_1000418_1_SI_GHA_SEK_038]|uniref:nuclease-related domain-containing protein n=1 Tax=Bacillus sp. DTU_2020_1000418_1_SI_GHA_SEK_038 TaxID=3077585 RepID=UPI0028E5575D|nr:nuclease-related domain-containing protein [Bacillus sp. DTU_2020_1000418_1_SI_GHA_SEK_038]WNS75750.1 nuclease-related domain-containing protein [Bacillus sp. DTU_2020_1000418_1_SI_GHA_SEK_038]
MAYKSRTEPDKLIILRLLNTRMTLTEKDSQHYFSLKKGYEGELMFDAMTEELQRDCYILNDLLFRFNNTMFQIDSMIIFSEKICFYEVKNFEGDYFCESDRLYKVPRTEYNNPLHQIYRSESLLRQLLQHIGTPLPIEANVVFINPEFTLYHAPLDKPFIFPTQVKSYLKKLDMTPSKLTGKHKKLADQLISLHSEENPYTLLPAYEYGQLSKGITCQACSSFSISVHGHYCVCGDCEQEELVTVAVLRSVREYMLLFPGEKITTNIIYDWCGGVIDKKTIRRVLLKNFNKIGTHQWTYYE